MVVRSAPVSLRTIVKLALDLIIMFFKWLSQYRARLSAPFSVNKFKIFKINREID